MKELIKKDEPDADSAEPSLDGGCDECFDLLVNACTGQLGNSNMVNCLRRLPVPVEDMKFPY